MTGRRIPRGVRRVPDASAMGHSMRAPGIDPRTWFAQGTVGTTTEDGTFNPTDDDAIHITAEGVIVDVQILTYAGERWPVTARYNGICGGPGLTIYSPIRPGDEVLVAFAGGRMEAAFILARLNNPSAPILGDTPGATPGSQPPTWQNDRLVINATEPLQIKAPALSIEAPMLSLNGRTVANKPEPL